MRSARRLLVALVCLIVLDQFVPEVLNRVERHRYEDDQAFRFESSDLFALGPLVSYLREHPRAERPRTLFLGNSVMFGYGLTAAEAVPARFQQRHPETRVLNAAVNGFELGSNYLVAKATIDAVDQFYVMRGPPLANPRLASLIPVNADDLAEFHVEAPDPLETRLQSIAGLWRLYASSYRLQAAVFGTSTRQYVYLHARPPATSVYTSQDGSIQVTRSRSATPPTGDRRDELRRQDALLWKFAELAYSHGKRAVFVQFGGVPQGAIGDPEIADFNAALAPLVELVKMTISPSLTYDTRHFTPIGAHKVAEALP